MLVKAGIHFEKFNYHDWPSGPDVSITRSSDKALLSYQASIMYNSLNNQRFSTQGMEWEAAYRLYTDNMITRVRIPNSLERIFLTEPGIHHHAIGVWKGGWKEYAVIGHI